MAQWMTNRVTEVLVGDLHLDWKASSLQAMHGWHTAPEDRWEFTTWSSSGAILKFETCEPMDLLGENVDRSGTSHLGQKYKLAIGTGVFLSVSEAVV
ncbi:hypothetical protein N9L68_00390 [bacterium]|nr:hypothetical protein [bacterium]